MTKSQSSVLFNHETEDSSNLGLACDFIISSLGLLGVLSLNKKKRKVIKEQETVIVVGDLLRNAASIAVEDTLIYRHLDLLTLKKRALVCLHTFVKDPEIRNQFFNAYSLASDIVQDFKEFISPNDSRICQRDALGVIAELINIPQVLDEIKKESALHKDLKRLVHSPSEGVATYSAYILYQINERPNNSNKLVPVPDEDLDLSLNSNSEFGSRKQSSISSDNEYDLGQIVPPRSESRV